MTAWHAIEADLRRAMVRAGKYEHEIVMALDALRPILVAVEKAGTKIDVDVAWALLATLADQRRRRVQAARTRVVA
jgi:hypothetical protein